MSPKSVAFLIVGMLVISSVFFIFHVTYPDSPATIKLNPKQLPKNITPPNMQIFNNQSINAPKLGLNQTSFTPSGNTSLILSGIVYNNSDPTQVLANQRLGIAVMQAFTMVTTNSQGYYQVKIVASGQGTFAFKVFQYATRLYQLYISPGTSSMTKDISLSPMQKYNVTGLTQSHGNDIPGVGLTFRSYWGSYTSTSSSAGAYSLSMVSDTYVILAQKTGFSSVPSPNNVTVNNAPVHNLIIQLNSSQQAILYMRGYVLNNLSQPVSGAIVSIISPSLPNSTAVSFANGYYNVSVAYYSNVVQVSAVGYTTLTQTVVVTHNLTNENFTITSFNPFLQGPNTGSTSPGPTGMSDNSANVNYASQSYPTISGIVYNNQTAMPVIDQQFTVYTSVNGTYYYYGMQSNSSGQYNINMSYAGYFNFTILSQKFNPTWLDQNLGSFQHANNIFIWVTTSQSNIFNINGSLLNGLNNMTLQNATINITGPGGALLKTIHVNPNGSYNFSLIGGNYQMNISAPGFNSTTRNLNVSGNLTNQNISLSPTTGISPGSSQWAPGNGTGLPGVNSTNVLNQFNATQNASGQPPTTTSSTPVNLTLQFYVNNTLTPIAFTEYLVYIDVNGLYLQVTNYTDQNGQSVLQLAYGGTYILLPEMLDYTGTAQFVNTSKVTGPIVFNMTQLPTYSLQLNLSNPYSYSGSTVPFSGLSTSGYSLSILPQSEYQYSNYTLVNYSLPNGTYNFSYNDPAYVPVPNFGVILSGGPQVYKEVLTPYILNLSWSSPVAWGYSITENSNLIFSNSVASGSSGITLGLTAGTFNFQSYIGNVSANNTVFTISSTAPEYSLNLVITGYTLNLTKYAQSTNVTLSGSGYHAIFNYTVPYLGSYVYAAQFVLDISSTDTVTVLFNSGAQSGTASTGYYTLSNYFAIRSTTPTAISIEANGITLQQFGNMMNNVNMVYYTVTLR